MAFTGLTVPNVHLAFITTGPGEKISHTLFAYALEIIVLSLAVIRKQGALHGNDLLKHSLRLSVLTCKRARVFVAFTC